MLKRKKTKQSSYVCIYHWGSQWAQCQSTSLWEMSWRACLQLGDQCCCFCKYVLHTDCWGQLVLTQKCWRVGRGTVCRRVSRAFILCQNSLKESMSVRTKEIQLVEVTLGFKKLFRKVQPFGLSMNVNHEIRRKDLPQGQTWDWRAERSGWLSLWREIVSGDLCEICAVQPV